MLYRKPPTPIMEICGVKKGRIKLSSGKSIGGKIPEGFTGICVNYIFVMESINEKFCMTFNWIGSANRHLLFSLLTCYLCGGDGVSILRLNL